MNAEVSRDTSLPLELLTTQSEAPSLAILGAGLAGLAVAVKAKLAIPGLEIVVFEKHPAQANSLISGQRIRAGQAGSRVDGRGEIERLLASRNGGDLTAEMRQFAELGPQEVEYWQSLPDFAPYQDNPNWFGPQWGTTYAQSMGRGRSVLRWFTEQAKGLGVEFMTAEAQALVLDDDHAEGLIIGTSDGKGALQVVADHFVLAGGTMGGRLYDSTNKSITFSAHDLAFDAGLSLVDSTVHMIHPFGRCDSDGTQRLGCFETDELADVNVYLDGMSKTPVFDAETTELLREHQAHYEFPDIAKRFREYGSVVMLQFASGEQKYARVSHHYSHLGIDTVDGTSVKGIDNLSAVGDASGLGYWTNHTERFPGFALLKCLVDAELVAQRLHQSVEASQKQTPLKLYRASGVEVAPDSRAQIRSEHDLKRVNSEHVHAWIATQAEDYRGRQQIAQEWGRILKELNPDVSTILGQVSLATAYAHQAIGAAEAVEPLPINRRLAEKIQDKRQVA